MAVAALLDAVEGEWSLQDPERRPTEARILERDGYLCAVPGCSRMDRLEVHHIRFRAAGGTNEPQNKTTLCHAHHRHGIHAGRIRLRGKAPHALRWQIGRRPGHRPLMTLRGERIAGRSTG